MYIRITNGQPENYTIGQLRKDNPNTSFPRQIPPATLEAYGMYPVFDTPQPATTELQTAVQSGYEQDAKGNWVKTWVVRDLYSDQLDENGAVIKSKAEQEQEHLDRIAQQKMQTYKDAVQNLLDSTAREKGYDSIISMVSYTGSSKAKWNQEAAVALQWRDDCWNESLVQMGNYIATGVEPDMDTFLASMPQPVWPA